MEPLEAAILRTILYADVFNFPMTAAEIHHYLLHNQSTSRAEVEQALADSPVLRSRLTEQAGYIAYADRGEIIALRQARERASQVLWPRATHYGVWLARLPFVRMVALTGALAMRNAAEADDDLDYMLITAPGRVWLARAFAIVLVRIGRGRGVEICPNYVLAESALEQDRHDIFIAHEVAQMAPVYGDALYWRMRDANAWVLDQLPNASGPFYHDAEPGIGRGWAAAKRAVEWLLGGALGDRLERWEQGRKIRRFASDMRIPHAAARLDGTQIKGHFNDHGHFVLQQYAERIRRCRLDRVPAPGD